MLKIEMSSEFETILSSIFTLPSLSHGLDEDAIKQFIHSADRSVKEICEKIIRATMHVSFKDFITKFSNIIKEYYENYKDFHTREKRPVYVFKSTIGINSNKSNYWFAEIAIKLLNDLFHPHGVEIKTLGDYEIRNNTDLKDEDIIIFTDDCIYSGNQLGQKYINTYASVGDKLRFYILIPYGSNDGINHIKLSYLGRYPNLSSREYNYYQEKIRNKCQDYCDKDTDEQTSKKQKIENILENRLIFSKNITIIPSMKSVINEGEFDLLASFYDEYNIYYNTHLVYFDHKLADAISIPTILYLGVVPNEKNKNIIISDEDPSTSINNKEGLEVIPLIKNCKFYTEKLSLQSPGCPRPPYKADYQETLKKIRDLNAAAMQEGGYSKQKLLKKYNKK
jgi:hypothetical protein